MDEHTMYVKLIYETFSEIWVFIQWWWWALRLHQLRTTDLNHFEGLHEAGTDPSCHWVRGALHPGLDWSPDDHRCNVQRQTTRHAHINSYR